ncbi:ethanolamine ammonia-lyase heavy subunit [Klebsiella pneumoniae]|uniref:Ethanolamine ammonia-lyase heavy subunit n=1 Tax=Klebsiella pneumoniae TaxID=573 RepID=A0A2X3DG51_KLEPN|nr:ethanolamine ammonia-lyase heavy subunit [Klebsiella pneumoniae]
MYKTTLSGQVWRFDSLKTLMAKASPARSGDALAGIIATSAEERMAAKMALAEVPLTDILDNPLIPYEQDEVTRLILDTHDAQGFAALRHLTVGDFRDWLLDDATDTATLQRVARAITPEMAAAVSKLMRNQDLILAASKCQVVTRFRNTIGLPGHLSVRLQPNHPYRRPERHRRQYARRAAVRRRGRGDRHQPGQRQLTGAGAAERHAGRYYSALRHPYPVLHSDPCDQYAAAD